MSSLLRIALLVTLAVVTTTSVVWSQPPPTIINKGDTPPPPPKLEPPKLEKPKAEADQKKDTVKQSEVKTPEIPDAKGENKDTAKNDEPTPLESATAKAEDGISRGDTAWMLVSTAFVMLMVPGLALFYGGTVRRKNVLATMMQSMICLSVVGVFWIAIGYSLAFGDPWLKMGGLSVLGFSPELVFMRGILPKTIVPGLTIPVYLHMAYQGMFAIITPALISGALAERIRFRSYLAFTLLWMVVVYCPLAQCVWAMNWNWTYSTQPNDAAKEAYVAQRTAAAKNDEEKAKIEENFAKTGTKMTGYLGAMDALDFAGGTVVHIAAGFSSLAAFLALRKRFGYPEHAFHPNSMVLTLLGAGLLWFGWFGFNGGSGLASGTLAVSAFTATQAAAAGAGLSWTLAEWIHRGKPTALGFASGVVAGLVAVTPAAGYILPWAGLVIGLISGVFCYASVLMKTVYKYDDSLDAFGVHGVGGFLGAVLTGVFCLKLVNPAIVNNGVIYAEGADQFTQLGIQFRASVASAALAFGASYILVKLVDLVLGFTVTADEETTGLDRVEHGESGFDLGLALEAAASPVSIEPKSAMQPTNGVRRFNVVVENVSIEDLSRMWADQWQSAASPSDEFKTIYPNFTTLQGNRFRFRGGDPEAMRDNLHRLLANRLHSGIHTWVE